MRGTSGIARIAGLGLVGSMILSACVAPAGAVQQQPDDHSMDRAERTRSVAGFVAKPDTSYDQVEHSRGSALSGPAAEPDTSYDQAERTRSLIGWSAEPDTSYGQAERVRGGAFGR